MSIYNYEVETVKGSKKSLKDFQNQVVLIVNTASKCGFTPQFAGLEELYQKYQDQGLVILGFPCNQFKEQDPGNNDEILEFCQVNYGVTFPMFAKIDVEGSSQEPLFGHLVNETGGQPVEWNFNKFLINRQGEVLQRFGSKVEPKELQSEIEKLL